MTDPNDTGSKKYIYTLVLEGDVVNTGGTIYVDIDVSSFDKDKLEALAQEKNETFRKEALDEGWKEGEEYCYMNTDYSDLPVWRVTGSELV